MAMTLRLLPLYLLCAVFALSACSGDNNKIGSTVKGDRVAIMEKSKSLTPDSDTANKKPELPEVVHNDNWPQAGYDATHVMPNAALSDAPHEVWSADIGKGSNSDYKLLARPVISNGLAVTMDSRGTVKAFDAQKGDQKWEFNTTPENADSDAIGGGLGAAGNMIYATTGFGEVIALNLQDGALAWRHSLQNPLRAASTLADGVVYAVSIDNQLTALKADSGEELWRHHGIIESATLMGASNPAVIGDSVVVAYSSGELFNLRAENGRVAWNYLLATPTQVGALPAIADIRGLPIIDRGHVFALSHSGRMVSVDHRTGDRDWEIDVGGINTPVVSADTVFVLNNDGQTVAVSRTDGRILWVHELQHLSEPDDKDSDPVFWTGPVLGGGALWLTNSLGQLVSLSPDDGHQLTNLDLGKASYIPPVISGGMIYTVLDNGRIVGLR